jgi:hypothetical protein
MTKSNYSDLLKDPLWQKKRLEIMHHDDFKCRDCGDSKKTLSVHHDIYIAGRMPWEYDEENMLVTLCEDCHKQRHISVLVIEDRGCLSPYEFLKINNRSNIAISEIGNHKGAWTVKIRDGASFYEVLEVLRDLKSFIENVDREIYVDNNYKYNVFDFILTLPF